MTSDPFNAVATVIFFAAIIHTFMAAKFRAIAHRFEREHAAVLHEYAPISGVGNNLDRVLDRKKFFAVIFHFLGEVEAIFGIWVIPLALAMVLMKGVNAATYYINGVNFTEPIFVVATMAIASSRPVLFFAEACLKRVALVGRGTPAAWWFSILTVGPLLGSLITEVAAMTICALLLARRFFQLNPSMSLRYATLGLLFVNISVGGTLTHFAAPPIVMVAGKWGWNLPFMLSMFGWKAFAGILLSNLLVFAVFRRELRALQVEDGGCLKGAAPVPAWIVLTNLLFIGFIVFFGHYAVIVVLTFMLFLAFVTATERNQNLVGLRSPILVGFFLAGLVIHGGCQQWWIEPVLRSMSPVQLLLGATVLTSFNDNAAITYLASLVPEFSLQAKCAVVMGAVAGGGLTVIANAPNPAGQSILQNYFGANGINAVKLLLAAIVPTIIMLLVFLFLT
ncbi:MAG: putative Na+/H+ antiporter [bacterium]